MAGWSFARRPGWPGDELVVMALLVLLVFPPLGVVLVLVCVLSRGLSLASTKVGMDSLLARGTARGKVEQLLHRPRLRTSKLVDKSLVGGARDEHSDYVGIDDVRELIALLREAVDVLSESLSSLLFITL